MVLRYADYDVDITAGKNYLAKGPIFKRDRVALKLGVQVDSMNVTVTSDENDTVGTKTFMQAAHLGAFDDGTMSLYRCFMSEPSVIVDILEMFTGEIEVKNAGGLNLGPGDKVQRTKAQCGISAAQLLCRVPV